MDNVYIVSFSRLQNMFMLVKASSRHIVKVCSSFDEVYKKVGELKACNDIELSFTDAAIDELTRQKLYERGCACGIC